MITPPGPTHQAIPHTTREAIRRHRRQGTRGNPSGYCAAARMSLSVRPAKRSVTLATAIVISRCRPGSPTPGRRCSRSSVIAALTGSFALLPAQGPQCPEPSPGVLEGVGGVVQTAPAQQRFSDCDPQSRQRDRLRHTSN